ncbi:two-partner secretion domain-containing protein, partial [Stutzerimonas tarimensis]
MDVRSPFFQNVATLLVGVMFLNPIVGAAAELSVAAGSGATLGQAGNGVPIVNIAAPNGKGLSHNKFKDYNVGQQGLILNNATERTQSTQLGGIILGNPNLKGAAAGLILNEVTGGNASRLQGYTEVAGQSAHVVVANPHGISCDGCGFINTPRVTLSTGTPVIDNGRLDRFDVDGGRIDIEGQGLNAGNVDQFDLITRSARINAELHANKLNIVTGRNQVDADDLSATAKTDSRDDQPLLAIDSSALGGMYAGAIRLVGTEAGVGVKLAGDMAASAGDIRIDANGKLTVGNAAASGQVIARAAEVESQGQLYAGSRLELQGQGELLNRGSLAARDAVVLSAGTNLDNRGHVEAGVNVDDSRNDSGDVRLEGQVVRNSGTVLASRDLQATAIDVLDNRDGQLVAQRNATVATDRLDNDRGRVTAVERLAVEAGQVDSREGHIASGGTLELRASGLDQRGGVLASQSALTLTLEGGTLNNDGALISAAETLRLADIGQASSRDGEIASRQSIEMAVEHLDNREGRLLAEDTLSVAGQVLDNRDGLLAANGDLNLDVIDIDNRAGELSTQAGLNVEAGHLDNSDGGRLLAAHLGLTVERLLNRNQGLLQAGQGLRLDGDRLDNAGGTLASGGDLLIQLSAQHGEHDGGLYNDSGLLSANGRLDLASAYLSNHQGRIEGRGAVNVATGALDNRLGHLIGLDRLDLSAAQVSNGEGRIAATGALVLRATGLDQQGGELFSQDNLTLDLQGGDLDNDGGLISAPGILLLNGLGAVSNRGGEISSSEGFTLAASQLDNDGGRLLSEQGLALRIQGILSNLAGLVSANRLDLAAARLDNTGGRLSSRGDLDAQVVQLNQSGGELLAEGALTITGETLDNRDGLLAANGDLILEVGEIDNRGGELSTRTQATIDSRRLDNSGGQLLAAHLNLTVERLLNRDQGLVYGWDETSLSGTRLDNSGGTLASDKTLVVELAARVGDAELDGSLDNLGGLLSSEGALNLVADSLDNSQGSISSAGTLQLTSAGELLNRDGRILTDAGLLLRSAGLDNRHGLVSAVGALSLFTGAFDNNEGQLTGSAELTLNAGPVTNTQGRIASSGPLLARLSGLHQQGGELFSQSSLELDLAGGDLNNDGGFINTPGQLLLSNLGAVSNRGGEISSREGFTLAANSLDNSAGRLLSEKNLAIAIEGALDNRAGSLSGQHLDLAANTLDNRDDGLVRSRGVLAVQVADTLTNRGGSLVADGGLELQAGHVDNREGQIAGRGDLVARVGELVQVGGELLAEGSLMLSGDSLDNRDGLLAANGDLILEVGEIDNRGGELSTRTQATIDSRRLDNSDGGRLLAAHLNLTVERLLNRDQGLVYGWDETRLSGARLDNSGGTLASDKVLVVELAARAGDAELDGRLDNLGGLLNSEDALNLTAARIDNRQGTLSSAGALQLVTTGELLNRDGRILTDSGLLLRSAGLDNDRGQIFAAGALDLASAALDNSEGRLTGGAGLTLSAGQVTNTQGRIASSGPLLASLTGLDQQGGELFSQDSLSLDLNGGDLINDGALLHAPGQLLLSNLGAVSNRGGEISSNQGFVLAADSLDNAQGRLLSEQGLVLRIRQLLGNFAGLISAQGIELAAAQLDNRGGTLAARDDLTVAVDGTLNNTDQGLIQAGAGLLLKGGELDNRGGYLLAGSVLRATLEGALDNRDGGLVNSQGGLELSAASLDSSQGGEVSAKGAMQLTLDALVQRQGALVGESALSLDLRQGALDNQGGLISSNGPLSLANLGLLDNRDGDIASLGLLELAAASLDNRDGRIISRDWLRLALGIVDNRNGLLSGWQGLELSGTRLDNRQLGTLSSRSGDLRVQLTGELLNSDDGALVAGGRLDLAADSLDNRGGILSSAAGQQLMVSGTLDNSGGQIDAGAGLRIEAGRLANQGGLVLAQQTLDVNGIELDNTGGRISASDAARIDLSGDFVNAAGQLASGGSLDIRAAALDNRGGTLASQETAVLDIDSLDNSARGTLAANGMLEIDAKGVVDNSDEGLIYSRDAHLQLAVGSLDNRAGAVQGQGDLVLTVDEALNNAGGTLQSRTGDIELSAASLDNRQGTLASLEGWVRARLAGWLNNGASGQGGLIQGRRLDLGANGSLSNLDGRIQAMAGEASLQAGTFDNRGGILFAEGDLLLRGGSLDNRSGTLGAANITLAHDAGAVLDNRQGIVESRGSLAVAGTRLDNQGGQLRALGATGASVFQLGGLLDNQNGTLEIANHDLTLNLGSLANQDGQLLHAGAGEFAIALPQVSSAGGRIATYGDLTLSAGSWSNDSVLQAGRLTLDIGTFTQTANGQLLATESLVGRGDTWTNHGLIASDGTLSLELTGSYGGDGRLTSLGDLGLVAASLSLTGPASIAAGGNATFALGGGLLNQGRLTAAGDLLLTAATLTNHGTLGSAERLILNATDLLNENGLIFSGDDMALYVDTFTNRYADVYSLGDIDLARNEQGDWAERLDNLSGTLEAEGDFRLGARVIDNTRDILVVDNVGKYAAVIKELACRGPYNPSGDCDLGGNGRRVGVWQVTERDKLEVVESSAASSLMAGGDLSISGEQLLNHSSLISAGGNIQASVAVLENQGVKPGDIETIRIFVSGRKPSYYHYADAAASFNRKHSPAPQLATLEADLNRFVGMMEREYLAGRQINETPLNGESYSAIIQAGGDIVLQAEQRLDNSVIRAQYAYLGGGNRVESSAPGTSIATHITLNSQLPPDLAQQQINPLTLPGFSLPSGENGLFRLSVQAGSDAQVRDTDGAQDWTITGSTLEQALRQEGVSALATDVRIGDAGDLVATELDVQAGNREQPSGLPAEVGGVQLGSQSATGTDGLETTALPGEQADAVRVTLNELQPGADLPRPQGVPVTQVTQAHKYLIETNPALTDLKQFMGSDYLLGNLGYDPDQAQKRLGDGLYEQRLIREAVVARTGQRYLAGLTSDEAMYRYLMDNAIASKDALGLSLGVTLTAEQVAALTHDIVWLEEYEVNGERVLVPVLYLAQAEGRLAANGALIQGRDVTLISGGDLANQGTLRASGDLDVQAVNIANSGLIEANERLQLLAENSIRNAQGGILTGRDVSLLAGNDILNERSVSVHQSALGNQQWVSSFADSAARIEASNGLSLIAGRDVANLGGVLDSRGDLSIDAGRDVTLASVQDVQHQSRGSSYLNERVTQLGAEVN